MSNPKLKALLAICALFVLNACLKDHPGKGNGFGVDEFFYPPSCVPFDQTEPIPQNTTAYADMCIEHVGVPPCVDCGDGVAIPIYVNGNEVFTNQSTCDHSDFKGTCNVGSRVGRVQGMDENGNPLPHVVWVYFCRSAGQTAFNDHGLVSVQMIGYNTETGATCFFESPDAVGDQTQANYLSYNNQGLLDGQLPCYGSAEFDQAWHSPAVSGTNCISCHKSDPFIHDPWIDGARLPADPTQPVIPEISGPDAPYFAVGGYGNKWNMANIHIEGNQCLSCHRANIYLANEIFDGNGNVLVNEFMPPHDPGTLSEDYIELIECWVNGPANTPGCNLVIPAAGDCPEELMD